MMNIFFSLKPRSRERQWDTVKKLPEEFQPIIPFIDGPLGSAHQHLFVDHEIRHRSLKRRVLETIPLVNLRLLPEQAKTADLIYTWGSFPFASSKPFMVELDNPYCLTFYSQNAAALFKPLIRHYLRKAARIVCLSKACQAHCTAVYGEEFQEKTRVLYPFSEQQPWVPLERSGPFRFLFVGLQFRIKGGPELLKAFHELSEPNISLTIISSVPEEVKQQYADDRRIHFVSPVSREELFTRYFPESDILVLPSFYESFGMVLLEALSFGLGLIATHVYATPEIIEDNVNGKLIPHPILAPERMGEKFIICPVHQKFRAFEEHYLNHQEPISRFSQDIKKALEEALINAARWKQESRRIFQERFAKKIWEASIHNIFSSV
jgi:glycosyltransferase involved in cell wall biosynthesis